MTDEKQGYCRFCGQAIYDATAVIIGVKPR